MILVGLDVGGSERPYEYRLFYYQEASQKGMQDRDWKNTDHQKEIYCLYAASESTTALSTTFIYHKEKRYEIYQ